MACHVECRLRVKSPRTRRGAPSGWSAPEGEADIIRQKTDIDARTSAVRPGPQIAVFASRARTRTRETQGFFCYSLPMPERRSTGVRAKAPVDRHEEKSQKRMLQSVRVRRSCPHLLDPLANPPLNLNSTCWCSPPPNIAAWPGEEALARSAWAETPHPCCRLRKSFVNPNTGLMQAYLKCHSIPWWAV